MGLLLPQAGMEMGKGFGGAGLVESPELAFAGKVVSGRKGNK